MTEEQAREVMESAMKVLFYRDARSLNKVSRKVDTNVGFERKEGRECGTDNKLLCCSFKLLLSPRTESRSGNHRSHPHRGLSLRDYEDVSLCLLGLA